MLEKLRHNKTLEPGQKIPFLRKRSGSAKLVDARVCTVPHLVWFGVSLVGVGEAVDVDDPLGAAGGQVGPIHRQGGPRDTAVVHHLRTAYRRPNIRRKNPTKSFAFENTKMD